MAMQRKPADLRPLSQPEPLPDIAELMNDWFFGVAKPGRRGRDPAGPPQREEARAKGAKNSVAGRSTQEWLADARRVVDASPTGNESPARFVGSPRFGSGQQPAAPSPLDRRDPLSRSARRHRALEGFSDEILRKSISHSRTSSEAFDDPGRRQDDCDHRGAALPPKQPGGGGARRKSRFGSGEAPQPAFAAIPPRRSRSSSEQEDLLVLSPPKNLVESAHRRSISSTTCSQEKLLSKKDVERRALAHYFDSADAAVISSGSSTTSGATPRERVVLEQPDEDAQQLNAFLRRQRAEMERICRGESPAMAKIILSGSSSNSTTSSMVAAICYAWLVGRRDEEEEEEGGGGERSRVVVVAPVLNMTRGKMWKHKQAAWLFRHVGIDPASLLFADEIDLESLLMSRQLNMLVIGQDVLKTNNKVGSQCTVLTNDYCEDAYDLLQRPNLKKLLLAGILLDIQNLRNTAKFLANRDTEAVQLLLSGFAPSYKDELLDKLMQEHKDCSFIEAMMNDYGKPPNDENHENKVFKKPQVSDKETTSTLHEEDNIPKLEIKKSSVGPKLSNASKPKKTVEATSNGKSKPFWTKWFAFKSK